MLHYCCDEEVTQAFSTGCRHGTHDDNPDLSFRQSMSITLFIIRLNFTSHLIRNCSAINYESQRFNAGIILRLY